MDTWEDQILVSRSDSASLYPEKCKTSADPAYYGIRLDICVVALRINEAGQGLSHFATDFTFKRYLKRNAHSSHLSQYLLQRSLSYLFICIMAQARRHTDKNS